MEVILVDDVSNLGKIGDLVKVKDGYARNFLFPRKAAIPASTNNVRRLEHEKRVAGARLTKVRADAEAVAKKIGELSVVISRKVGDQDKMFGSVTSRDVHDALVEMKVEIDRHDIHLDEPIKALGVYQVAVRLKGGVQAKLTVTVVADQA